MIEMLYFLSMHAERRKKGAIFCHVIRIELLIHERPSIICGTHRWKGAAPILIRRLIMIKIENRFKDDKKENKFLVVRALEIRIADAKAWTRKYFNVASEFREEGLDRNKASRASMLISKPIHAINQEEAEIATNDPRVKINKNKNFQGRIKIKRRINP